jgi:hypothetical protein
VLPPQYTELGTDLMRKVEWTQILQEPKKLVATLPRLVLLPLVQVSISKPFQDIRSGRQFPTVPEKERQAKEGMRDVTFRPVE